MRLIMSNLCRGWKVLIWRRGDFLGGSGSCVVLNCVVRPLRLQRCMLHVALVSMWRHRYDGCRKQIKVAHLAQCLHRSSAHHPLKRCDLLLLAANFFIPAFILSPLAKHYTHSAFCLISRSARCCKILWRREKKTCEKVQRGPYVPACLFFPRKAVKRELYNQRSNKPVDVLHCLSREWVVAPATAPQALQVNGRK